VIEYLVVSKQFSFGPVAERFFPAYNDAPSLPPLIEKTFAVLAACACDYEVIVINDGSSDSTGEVLADLARKFAPRMRVITHSRNLGYGQALRSGFAAAAKELVFYTDGDGQYDVGELPRLLAGLRGNVGLGKRLQAGAERSLASHLHRQRV